MNNTTKIITATAIGVSIGALLGILFAPDKGSETRQKIKDKTKSLVNTGKEKLTGLKEEFMESINGTKEPDSNLSS